MDHEASREVTTGRSGSPAPAVGAPFRVLALDGGGMRGFFTARVLEGLVERAGGDPWATDLGAAFKLIVGTSTGSLLATAIAMGIPLPRIASLFREKGSSIFPRPAPFGWRTLAWCAWHWRRPSADERSLRDVLDALFGTATLGQLFASRGIALCVPVTDLRSAGGRVLATPHAAARDASSAIALVDACMASCAAPMLLPPLPLPAAGDEGARWCDGGLWATSPVLVALAESLAIAPAECPIEIVSVGTCAMPVPASVIARPPGRGIGLWIRGLRAVQVTGDAQGRGAVDLARRLVPELRRNVRLVRLREPEPTDEEAAEVRLDNGSPRALGAMERLARAAVELNGLAADDAASDGACLAAMLAAAVEAKPLKTH
jgi:uncharacterized protein